MINNPTQAHALPSVSIATARTGASSKINALGMRPMQERPSPQSAPRKRGRGVKPGAA